MSRTTRLARDPVDHFSAGLLGVVTIAAYGSWYYSFGVLLDPIRADTGWSESTLAASFSLGLAIVGVGSVFGGKLLDRVGSRTVLLVGGVVGSTGMLVTSYADHIVVFVLSSSAALGVVGSLGFYHVTMATVVRSNPEAAARAIGVLTVWGAFASAIYLPMTGLLIDAYSWRVVTRVLASSVAVTFIAAAMLVPVTAADASPERMGVRALVRTTVATAERRAFTAAVALGGIALSCVLVYQVPAMTAAGLPLTTAATVAGVRGFLQLGGRLPLGRLVGRLGSTRSLLVAFAAMAVGGGLLAVAGNVPVAAAFAVVTGFGIGAFSPLQGIKAEELFDRRSLGATMGFYGTVLMLSGAIGPAVGGVLADATDDRRIVAALIVASSCGAMVATARLLRAD